ncbi:hypothetical protein DRA42_12950 [Ethanoligenens harbinense]|nr:hypothetical protein CXQ68_12900 [Ethanoligenens harbinense YUAN-3]AYF39685.1 hypothetical protein CXP51_12800 [Ethanoligenens harbinense]AYF42516.1 hypothetical protein CN246_13370 [Ethanoligenens harbinense]QCN93266.1 hypothetical protein DRA42_12950 [Ethanoligenens harbinense]
MQKKYFGNTVKSRDPNKQGIRTNGRRKAAKKYRQNAYSLYRACFILQGKFPFFVALSRNWSQNIEFCA